MIWNYSYFLFESDPHDREYESVIGRQLLAVRQHDALQVVVESVIWRNRQQACLRFALHRNWDRTLCRNDRRICGFPRNIVWLCPGLTKD